MFAKHEINSLSYLFPSQLMKTMQSDIIVVIVGNVQASKTIPFVLYN